MLSCLFCKLLCHSMLLKKASEQKYHKNCIALLNSVNLLTCRDCDSTPCTSPKSANGVIREIKEKPPLLIWVVGWVCHVMLWQSLRKKMPTAAETCCYFMQRERNVCEHDNYNAWVANMHSLWRFSIAWYKLQLLPGFFCFPLSLSIVFAIYKALTTIN